MKETVSLQDKMIKSYQDDLKSMTIAESKARATIKQMTIAEQEASENSRVEVRKLNEKYDANNNEWSLKTLSLNQELNSLHEFKSKKMEIEGQVRQLEQDLQDEKDAHTRDIQDMDRQKIQATEKLKKDMLYKIKETKHNLLRLNDEQLHTTTRLTVLENHRLTTELEYQSKQTEKLLLRNQKLQEQVLGLKRDVEIHKQVESELAKRSHFCQKIIKKLNAKIKDYEGDSKSNIDTESNISKDEVAPAAANARDRGQQEDLLQFLEHKLEEKESKLSHFQSEYNTLLNDYKTLKQRIQDRNKKYQNIADILSEYLEDIKSSSSSLGSDDRSVTVNLQRIVTTPAERLTEGDKSSLVTILLKQIQPFINTSNLVIPEIKEVNVITGAQDSAFDLEAFQERNDSLPPIQKTKLPGVETAVQTTFGPGTLEPPQFDLDIEAIRGPVRPWGKQVNSFGGKQHQRKQNQPSSRRR